MILNKSLKKTPLEKTRNFRNTNAHFLIRILFKIRCVSFDKTSVQKYASLFRKFPWKSAAPSLHYGASIPRFFVALRASKDLLSLVEVKKTVILREESDESIFSPLLFFPNDLLTSTLSCYVTWRCRTGAWKKRLWKLKELSEQRCVTFDRNSVQKYKFCQ